MPLSLVGSKPATRAPLGPAVAISYRRDDASYLAAWLYDRLAEEFGDADVFLDTDSLRPGVDFIEVITDAIANAGVLLVIVGPGWLATDRDGRRRLDDARDVVRLELETALKRGV